MSVENNVLTSPFAGPKEWAMAFTENREGSWWEKVVKSRLVFDTLGNPAFNVDRSTLLNEAEYQGMMKMRDWAMLGRKWMVWISPMGGDSPYPQSRVVVGRVDEKVGNVEIETLNICSPHTPDECLRMAGKLLASGGEVFGEVVSVEDLRGQAIGLRVDDEKMWNLVREVIDVEGVWEAVVDGRVEENNRAMEKRMRQVVVDLPNVRDMSGWMLQRYLEVEMARNFGVRLQTGGNHGGSVLGGGVGMGSFDRVWFGIRPNNLDEKLSWCHTCSEAYMKKKGKCPRCGKGD